MNRASAENVPVCFEEFSPTYQVWMEVSAYPSSGGLSVFVKDISERKRHEEERRLLDERLHQASQNLLAVLENMSDGFMIIDRDWTIKFATDRVAAMIGVNKEAYVGKNLWNCFPAAVHTKFYSEYQRAFTENTFVTFEEYEASFGKWFEVNVYPGNNELSVYIKDISERKKQKNRLEFIAKAMAEVVWERPFASEEAFIHAEKFRQVFGYKLPGNYIHRSFWLERVHPCDVRRTQENKAFALEHKLEFYLNEYRFQKGGGDWAYVKERIYIVRNMAGEPETLIGAMEDVTSMRRSEAALVVSEKKYRQLFNNAPLPTFICDAETLRYLDVNDTALQQFGYSREEFLRMSLLDIRPPEEHKRTLDGIEKIKGRSTSLSEVFTYLKKGGERMLGSVVVAEIDYNGKKAMLATIEDVTEKVKLRKQLVREKLNHQKSITKAVIEAQEHERSEIGKELHDNVNQILTSAKLYVENSGYFPQQAQAFLDKGASLIQQSINEIRRLSKALVTPSIRDVGFKDSLLDLIQSYQDLKLFQVEGTLSFDEKVLDKELKLTLYRILQEQFNNTVKYAKAAQVQVVLKSTGTNLRMVYADNGIGFDPFAVKRGLGLNNIKNRVHAYRGKMLIRSAVGSGYRMVVSFPLRSNNGSSQAG